MRLYFKTMVYIASPASHVIHLEKTKGEFSYNLLQKERNLNASQVV
jgi:hypothetical protein